MRRWPRSLHQSSNDKMAPWSIAGGGELLDDSSVIKDLYEVREVYRNEEVKFRCHCLLHSLVIGNSGHIIAAWRSQQMIKQNCKLVLHYPCSNCLNLVYEQQSGSQSNCRTIF